MRVGIVGAGISGLALTHFLAENDVDVITFEADAEPGGVIRSDKVDGRVLEYGPQRIRLSKPVDDLISSLNLESQLLQGDPNRPLYVYVDGSLRIVPRSLLSFVRSDILSLRGKLRVLVEPLTKPISAGELAGDAFQRKFGTEAYHNIIEPLFGGIYASNPARIPVEYALPSLTGQSRKHGSLFLRARRAFGRNRQLPPPVTFRDGLQTLPMALYNKHRHYVHLETPIDSINLHTEGSAVDLISGRRTTTVDHVVITVPARPAASILEATTGAEVAGLNRLSYNSIVLVHLYADIDREGFGYQTARTEELMTRGVTWNAGLFDRDGVFTAFLGGVGADEILEWPADEIGAVAAREFEQIIGIEPVVLNVTKLPDVIPAYDTSWRHLDHIELPPCLSLFTNYTGRIGVPSRIRLAKQLADELVSNPG